MLSDDLQNGVAELFQFGAADAGDGAQGVQVRGLGAGDGGEGLVAEDAVGGQGGVAGFQASPVAEGIIQVGIGFGIRLGPPAPNTGGVGGAGDGAGGARGWG